MMNLQGCIRLAEMYSFWVAFLQSPSILSSFMFFFILSSLFGNARLLSLLLASRADSFTRARIPKRQLTGCFNTLKSAEKREINRLRDLHVAYSLQTYLHAPLNAWFNSYCHGIMIPHPGFLLFFQTPTRSPPTGYKERQSPPPPSPGKLSIDSVHSSASQGDKNSNFNLLTKQWNFTQQTCWNFSKKNTTLNAPLFGFPLALRIWCKVFISG